MALSTDYAAFTDLEIKSNGNLESYYSLFADQSPELDHYTVTVGVSRGYKGEPLNNSVVRYLLTRILRDQTVHLDNYFDVMDVKRSSEDF